jgi:hypothetical protein
LTLSEEPKEYLFHRECDENRPQSAASMSSLQARCALGEQEQAFLKRQHGSRDALAAF